MTEEDRIMEVEWIDNQLKDDYLDIGFHDYMALDVVREAVGLYKEKYHIK
jgi:hypothetical protein